MKNFSQITENLDVANKKYVDDELDKLARTVNNGALTLTVNGTAHTFTANQSGDTSVTINDTGVTSVSLSGDGNAVTNASIDGRALTLTKGTTFLTSHQSIKSINTNNTAAQEPKTDESIAGSGTINLHKIAKTGNYNDLLHKPTLGTAAEKNVGTSSGNVPILDSNGKLADSVIPAVAITDTYVIDTEEEMLALSAQKGDIAIRSDLNKSYVLQTTPASTLANWKELLTPTDTVLSVNGQTGTVELTASDVKALPSSTKYAASSEVGGAATSANKVNSNLIVKLNSGATEGTNLFTFNGSAAKTINITPSAIGAAASSHGTHVTADTVKSALGIGPGTSKYLREDGTWQTPPNTATAADNLLDGSNSGTQITYAPYTSQQSKLSFDSSNTEPTRSDRLNLNGYLHATKLYSGGKEVLTSHQDISGKLDKTTYEWNKEFAAGSNGAISLGRYNIYDTQLTFDISSTTSASMSGKLVIATQNGKIIQAKVFGDATGALVSKIVIYQSSIINNRSWVEVFCNFDGWSKNKVHIYGVALDSAIVTNQMSSVTFTNGVPSPITSGDSKWNGTIDNDLSVPKVNNGTLTIQKNGTKVATFTANQSGNVTANITVPTVNNGKLIIQKNGTNVATFTANQSANTTANITVPLTPFSSDDLSTGTFGSTTISRSNTTKAVYFEDRDTSVCGFLYGTRYTSPKLYYLTNVSYEMTSSGSQYTFIFNKYTFNSNEKIIKSAHKIALLGSGKTDYSEQVSISGTFYYKVLE